MADPVVISASGPSATYRATLNDAANANVSVTFPSWVRQAMVRFVDSNGVDKSGTVEMSGTHGVARSVNAFQVGTGESFPIILNQNSTNNVAYLCCNTINCYGMIYLISQILPVTVQGNQTIDISGEDVVVSNTSATAMYVRNQDGGALEITNDAGNPISVSGTLTAVTSITNTVLIDNAVGQTVDVSDGGGSLTVDGTVTVTNTSGAALFVQNQTGDPLNVEGTVTVGSGTLTAVTSITNTVLIDNAVGQTVDVSDGGGSLTVDGTVALSGGTVTSITNPVEITNDSGNPISVTGTITAVTSITNAVEITNDAGSPISVSDGGGSLTVDGTVDLSGLSYSGQVISDMRLDPKGQIEISAIKPSSSFYEISTAENNPVTQLDFSSGILFTELLNTTTNGSGTVTVGVSGTNTSIASVSTGTTSNSGAMITSKRLLRAKSGQGVLERFAAKFTTGVAGAGSLQVVGLLNTEVGYGFGYKEADFGIISRTNGRVKIHKWTVTQGPSTSGDITIVLNGATGVVTALTSGWSIARTAQAIASSTYTGWNAYAVGADIYFVGSAMAMNGTYSFDAGTTGSTVSAAGGTSAQTGVAPTNTLIAQTTWSEDKFDGAANSTNPSGMTLVPTNGNAYYIMLQPAFGYIEFGIQTSLGRLQPAHRIYQENSSTSLNLYASALPIQAEALTTTTTSLVVYLANAGAFLQGPNKVTGPKGVVQDTATLASGVTYPVLSIRNPRSISNTVNYAEAVAKYLSTSVINGTGAVNFQIYRNATLTAPLWTSITNSILEQETSATAISGGTLLGGFSQSTSGGLDEDLSDMEIVLAPGDTITISALTSGVADVAATFVCQQDVG